MREGIGSTMLYNIVIVFMSIIFALILGTIVYYKAFKVNKVIISSLEKYEGYNVLAKKEIELDLKSIGYPSRETGDCPSKNGVKASEPISKEYRYCIYYYDNDGSNEYYSYGVISYITFDFPFIESSFFTFPIYTRSDRIYRFE